MFHQIYFVCPTCQSYADSSSSHSDVGGCKTCHAPMVWHYDGHESLTAWCDCHDWQAGRIARKQADIFEIGEPVICPKCAHEMSREDEPGAALLPSVECPHPLKYKWLPWG